MQSRAVRPIGDECDRPRGRAFRATGPNRRPRDPRNVVFVKSRAAHDVVAGAGGRPQRTQDRRLKFADLWAMWLVAELEWAPLRFGRESDR